MKRLLTAALLVTATGCPAIVPPPPVPTRTEDVSFPSGKEEVRATLVRPGEGSSFPAVILVHGDFGVTDWLNDQADDLADLGYAVLVVDLYRGDRPADLMDAHILGRGLPDDRAVADIKAAVDYLGGRKDVRPDAIGIVGFGMGGGYALDAALADPRLKAVVTCYGRVPTEAETLKSLQAPVLAVFAEKDEGITAQTREQFRTAMQKAGKRLAGMHVYAGCGHGFLDPTEPSPSGTDADRRDAWGRITAFLAAELRKQN